VKNIAFVSIGDESHNCADLLVKSIKKNNSDCQIIQVSTKKDKDVIGVDEKLIFDFKSATFMFNRLESQIAVLEKFGPTIFLDTDMLVNKDLSAIFDRLLNNDIVFTQRKNNFYINDTFQNIKFPEFTNKTVNEVMPFNGGFLGVSNIAVQKKLLQIYLELPSKFHYWYGDQVALKKIYDTKEFKISLLDSNYNYNVKDISNYDKKICIYHFKGRFKKLMNPFYEKYIR